MEDGVKRGERMQKLTTEICDILEKCEAHELPIQGMGAISMIATTVMTLGPKKLKKRLERYKH